MIARGVLAFAGQSGVVTVNMRLPNVGNLVNPYVA